MILYRIFAKLFFKNNFEFTDKKLTHTRFTVWFHAASAGEFEVLWPIVVKLNELNEFNFVLTTFSQSGLNSVKKCGALLEKNCLYAGLSPREGGWLDALKAVGPKFFVSVKYEAWPDLWASLSELKIPLHLINAKKRSSLVFINAVLKLLFMQCPNLYLYTAQKKEVEELESLFKDAIVYRIGDPRWDRVYSRMHLQSEAFKKWLQNFIDQKTPWAVMGSIWMSDLEYLESHSKTLELFLKQCATLWIFPHDLSSSNVTHIKNFLENRKINCVTSLEYRLKGTKQFSSPKVIIVNEMGILTEFYKYSAWVYIGGGFEKGIHSTIEPAVAGIPVISGSKRENQFYEVSLLENEGQLLVLREPQDCKKIGDHLQRNNLKMDQSNLGAADRFLSKLKELGYIKWQ